MDTKETKKFPITDSVTDYRQLKDSEYLGHWDLPDGKPYKLTIEAVHKEELFNPGNNQKEIKPVASFKDKKKRLVLNATNMAAIASWHGNDPHSWPGKEVELYRTTTKLKGKPTECLRIKADGTKQVKENSSKAAEAAQ